MHVSMPPYMPPPDDARRLAPASEGGNVVDPTVLAERRAQRAEQSEQSAARRAADAQVLAAQLARERARLEAERDAARAEAAAAREGADAAIAEARHLQAERDSLRGALAQAREERDALAAAARAAVPDAAPAGRAASGGGEPAAGVRGPAGAAPANGSANGARNGHAAPAVAWPAALRRELALARAAAPITAPPPPPRVSAPAPGLVRERRLLARRAAAGPIAPGASVAAAGETASSRRSDRAAPITALALERERSSRLQAQLDASLAVQRELRTHVAALQRAVHQRVEAERRIEAALRRVREELTAANLLGAQRAAARAQPEPPQPQRPAPDAPPRAPAGTAAPSAVPSPATAAADSGGASERSAPAPAPAVPAAHLAQPPADADASAGAAQAPVTAAAPAPAAPSAGPAAPGGALDPLRLAAARDRLRAAAAVPAEDAAAPAGPPAPWLTAALRELLASEPALAGPIAIGLLPAQGLAAQRPLRCDLLLSGRGCYALDLAPGAASMTPRSAPRPRRERDLGVAGDAAGIARLLHGRRRVRRPARVRGGRRALRELRRIARAPVALRELAAAGVVLDPALALRLLALAIDPAATRGERFAVAHAPLAGGPVDAWLRIADGAPVEVCDRVPVEPVRLTLRCTRGAILPLIAGVEPPPGEAGTLAGDDRALALLRRWIAQTEHPAA